MDELFTASVFAAMIRLATPYIFAAIGETFSQRSGVLNLGLDGMMLMGAFAAFYVTFKIQDVPEGELTEGLIQQSLILGVLAALIVGVLMGLIAAFVSVTLKAEQGISGIGIYLFGLGLSTLLYQELIGTPKSVAGFPRVNFGALPDIRFRRVYIRELSDIEFLGIGEIFFQHNFLVYLAFALVPIAAYILNRTTFGLQIRAVGQNPEAADAMGVSVARVRYLTVILSGTMAGLAGASMSIALLRVFQENLTAGLGFIAVALVYFGGWRPYGVMAGALLFSFVNALQLQINTVDVDINLNILGLLETDFNTADIPAEFLVMAPYVITIIALVFASKRHEKPTALTKPFARGG